eukprot:gnl/TRDRNA2_/TRDRNA2_173293_c4_seq1.p1 gnl/TRDRNA2_/TRDRNA2_173293_c4~~gnl/TRDRNA2_/TRDRNA2_173293_c4_seq1.p1  ORF type:complete len:108 (+),score=7.61 gnl/TRDRNA2_/TRDRNA2_173293_c4_seq1:429-752(+)
MFVAADFVREDAGKYFVSLLPPLFDEALSSGEAIAFHIFRVLSLRSIVCMLTGQCNAQDTGCSIPQATSRPNFHHLIPCKKSALDSAWRPFARMHFLCSSPRLAFLL